MVQRVAIDEVDLDALQEGALADRQHHRRCEQRKHPRLGIWAGRWRVYVKLPDPEDSATLWLTEHDSNGRRFGQVEQRADGAAVRAADSDWPMNPVGLLQAQERDQNQCHDQETRARPD